MTCEIVELCTVGNQDAQTGADRGVKRPELGAQANLHHPRPVYATH